MRMGADFTVLPSTFDALVAVLVKIGKVLPQLLVSSMNDISIFDGGELGCQGSNCGNVEFVLMGL